MNKETRGSENKSGQIPLRRFHLGALEFMGDVGTSLNDPKYWIAVTWDGDEMTEAVRQIKTEQGMGVTRVDLTKCWNGLKRRFELPKVTGNAEKKQVLILDGFDEIALRVKNIWMELSSPLQQFVESTGGSVFVAYNPIVGKFVRPVEGIRSDLRVYDQAKCGGGEITSIESVADRSVSFGECINDPRKMGSWVEEKWFKYLEKESVSKKELFKEVVLRLSLLPGTFRESEIAEALKLSLDQVSRIYGLPVEFRDYQENLRNGKWGKDASKVLEVLLGNAMMSWKTDGGGYVITPTLRLPTEMVFAWENWQRYQVIVAGWAEYFRNESETWAKKTDPRSGEISKYYTESSQAVEERANFVAKKAGRYFGM